MDKMKNIYYKLDELITKLRNIRDNQKEFDCSEDRCICNQFDLVIDDIEILKEIFKELMT